jgi:hypothetical protein
MAVKVVVVTVVPVAVTVAVASVTMGVERATDKTPDTALSIPGMALIASTRSDMKVLDIGADRAPTTEVAVTPTPACALTSDVLMGIVIM